jgi:hypothetical protein
MGSVADTFLKDALEHVKSPEVKSSVYSIFAYFFDFLYPYVLAVVGILVAILAGVVILVVRGIQ